MDGARGHRHFYFIIRWHDCCTTVSISPYPWIWSDGHGHSTRESSAREGPQGHPQGRQNGGRVGRRICGPAGGKGPRHGRAFEGSEGAKNGTAAKASDREDDA